MGDAPVLWGSKRPSVVALLTCAAEYVVLCNSTQHLVQEINQLNQLVSDFDKTIFCNNQAAVQVSLDNKSHKWMRYLGRVFLSTTQSANTASRSHGSRRTTCWPMLSPRDSQDQHCSGHSISWGIGTDRRASFAAPGPFLTGNESYPDLSSIGGDGIGTDQQVSFAAPGPFLTGNESYPDLSSIGGDGIGTDRQESFVAPGPFLTKANPKNFIQYIYTRALLL
ncbi:hypothetical protein O181_119048 [Austropuccinia psidii MF-1]|uniref:Uncharacterized protein n=1 Tax=Austropuccinia psidii MF-1 TaxID=1389203 RepID=A0A9Q3PZ00_9BASI|nr:hypothetical protein [Austropuccinia psidii MF-1]